MNDQIYQNVSNTQPVHSNSSNDGNSSITSKMLQNKVFKQTFGECERCHKNEIKTMHMRCRHITCCFTCAKTCEECPKCGLPSRKHLPVYATYCEPPSTTSSKTDQVDNECTGGQPEEPKRKNASDNEFDHNKILDGSSGNHKLAVNDAAEKKDQRDELYDPNATRMLGTCCICLSYNATCFILSESKEADEERCGHSVCVNCIMPPIYKCPTCRGNIISFLEAKDWP